MNHDAFQNSYDEHVDNSTPFGFATDVMVSTIKGCTIVDMFIVNVLLCIMTHSFVSLDMFVVCIVSYNDYCPG